MAKIERDPDSTTVMLARARSWYERIIAGEVQSVDDLARKANTTRRSAGRVLKWATLSPQIVETIVRGTQRTKLTTHEYLRDIPP